MLLLVTCLLIYMLFRNTVRESLLKDNEGDHYTEVNSLIDRWRTQNDWIFDKLIELCMAFVSAPPGSAMLPKNVQDIYFNPELSSPLSFELSKYPLFYADSVSVFVRVYSRRLSFSAIANSPDPVRLNLTLGEFTVEVNLIMSFKNSELLGVSAIPSKPSFSLFIDSEKMIEISKSDVSKFTEDIIRNAYQIWPNAQALLEVYPHLKLLYQKKALTLIEDFQENFDENGTTDTDFLVDMESTSSIETNNVSSNKTATGELPSNCFLTPASAEETTLPSLSRQNQHPRDNHPSSRSPSPVPQTDDMVTQNGDESIANETTESIEGGTSGMVVLAHNPGLKHKLASAHVRPPFLRSASDYEKQAEAAPEETGLDLHSVNEPHAEPEPVPLDPIVHPPSSEMEEFSEMAAVPVVSRSANSSQRRHRAAASDISPHRERVSTTLSSKNLLVKVVKADFIDLRGTSDAYCVVELDEPYQRHATHVVPPSEQLFWDQHLLFGLNSNSKRAAFEVFELSKRKKSISRGYAEIHLSDLLSSASGALGGTELMRCIPLEVKHQSSSSGGKWEHAQTPISSLASLTICKPSITAEFHFMERIVEDPFSVCKGRASLNSPTAVRKRRSSLAAAPEHTSDEVKPFPQNYEFGGPSSSGSTGSTRASTGSREKEATDPTANGDNQEGNHSSSLSRSTSVRGSRLFEPAFENLREPSSVTASVLSRNRQQPRSFMAPRLSLSSCRRNTSTGVGKPNGMGLLGPSSQLAGMVASLTAASADVETAVDPSTAAAVASAVAVAAATGGLSAGGGGGGAGDHALRAPTTDGAQRRRRGTPVIATSTAADSLFDSEFMAETGGSGSGGDQTLVNRMPSFGDQQQPVVRYTAPAANIAESLGTYSAQPQQRRSDVSPGGLMKLFKQKKKPVNSPNVAKLMYLENLDTSEFDTISTEGYQRILKGERMYQDDAS